MSRNNVRGPTSALTDFLREHQITPTTVAARRATQNRPQPVAGPSNSAQSEAQAQPDATEEEPTSRRRRRTRATAPTDYDSDALDEPEAPASKKQKTSKAQAKDKKKAKKDDGDGEWQDEDDDAYTALSRLRASNKPPNGSIETCAECKKEFSVSQYTIAAAPGPGYLCHPCAKKLGNDPFKKPAAPRKRAKATERRNLVHFEERRFPTLVSMCINIITKHIDDIEAFGDIGTLNMEAISKTISKKRSLNSENVHLFYGAEHTSLTLYDVTKLSPTAFITLGHLNPNLTALRLDFCGLISDEVLSSWCTSLPSLAHLQLLGPFLVRPAAWIAFFESHPRLESFLITQSPRFNLECLQTLIDTSSKTLKRLGLREVGLLSDDFLVPIALLSGQLTYLDISEPSNSCSDEAVTSLLEAVGSTLTHLNLSGHIKLSDDVLQSGILPNIGTLQELILSNIPLFTDEGVARFFSEWSNTPLSVLDLSRNPVLSTNSLIELLNHSGDGIQSLDVNGWKDVSATALSNIAKQAKDLRRIDLGWCREVDDFIVKAILENCKSWLSEVKVWGCNKVEGRWASSGTKTKAKILGIESHTSI